jgi:LytS/YehU family sensor histidine kinase
MILADEFRLINQVSSKATIPIREEIRLCEYHLKLMGFRNEVQYRLIKENIDKNDFVPPMVFHTLIENGLSHAYQPKEAGTFRLFMQKNHKCILYRLTNDGSLLKDYSKKPKLQIEEGMGMKYIKARLEESYPSKWKVEYGLRNGNWNVDIRILK